MLHRLHLMRWQALQHSNRSRGRRRTCYDVTTRRAQMWRKQAEPKNPATLVEHSGIEERFGRSKTKPARIEYAFGVKLLLERKKCLLFG